MSAATLAILGDYVPFGVGQALGEFVGGSSLDNTLRVCRLVPDRVGAHRRAGRTRCSAGSATARVNLWAEDGTLLATAGAVVRRAPLAGRPGGRRPIRPGTAAAPNPRGMKLAV